MTSPPQPPFSPSDRDLELDRTCRRLGATIRAARQARGWTLQDVARATSLAQSTVARIETGQPGGLMTYLRITDSLGLRLTWEIHAVAAALETEDAVHAVMGEVQARRFGTGSRQVFIDEPYQRFRFAGRGDVVVVDRVRRALAHSENKTRIVNVGELGGSFNAKCLWLPGHIAERVGARRFTSETHTLVLLWSEEVLTAARSLRTTLNALGPDGTAAFAAWWNGSPLPGTHRCVVVLDPIDRGPSQPRWVSLEEALDMRPRYRGYADVREELGRAGMAGSNVWEDLPRRWRVSTRDGEVPDVVEGGTR